MASIAPVIGRIQSIESRFSVPSSARLSVTGGASSQDDFAAALSAAFADSSALLGGGTSATGAGSTSSTAGLGATMPTLPASTGLFATPIGATTTTTAVRSTDGSGAYDALFTEAGARHGVPAELLSAVGYVESRYRPEAVSSAGAIGLMQIMPFVADELGIDPTDPAQAIDGAARLLRSHYDRFGSWDLALAAYNAGAGAVKRAGNTIPSPGVAEYVRRVNERMALS